MYFDINNVSDIPLWISICDLLMITWTAFIFTNRFILCVSGIRNDSLGNRSFIHTSTVTTFFYTFYTIYVYFINAYEKTSDKHCTFIGKFGCCLYFVSNFSIWMFYWQKHGALPKHFRHYHQRIQRIGIVLYTACLLTAGVLILTFWQEANNNDKKTCIDADVHRLGIQYFADNEMILMIIDVMDMVCSFFITSTFVIPMCKRVKMLGRNLDDKQGSSFENALRRLALCAFASTFSSVVCIGCYVTIDKTLGNFHFADMFLILDGAVNVTAVNFSIVDKYRWSLNCHFWRCLKCMQGKENAYSWRKLEDTEASDKIPIE